MQKVIIFTKKDKYSWDSYLKQVQVIVLFVSVKKVLVLFELFIDNFILTSVLTTNVFLSLLYTFERSDK